MFLKFSKRFYSELKSPCLVRDFIYDRLYHPTSGYFCKKDIQIGELKTHINFKSMIGYDDYKHFLFENYPENAWLTPSELFRPWYGFTIANYIHGVIKKLKLDPKANKIRIIEIGAGTASALDSILVFFNNYEKSLYNMIEFHIVEISPQMCQRAKEKLEINHKKLIERGQIRIFNDDFLHYKVSTNNNNKEFNFLIFLEVLDNMPHDKVNFCERTKEWKFQTMIEFDHSNQNIKETQTLITDTLIKEGLLIYQDLLKNDNEQEKEEKSILERLLMKKMWFRNQKSLFLPTFSLKMLKYLNEYLPNHHLIIADFDQLPSDKLSKNGINAPIVSRKLKRSHEKKDFDNYLVQKGEADIFFPTNFELLQKMYLEVCKKKSLSMKSHVFMNEFAKEKWAETRSGYNPLKEDFLNTSFLVTDI